MAIYYVDKTHGSASDSNAGTSPSLPWLTIAKAAATMVAGDTCNVLAGSYDERPNLTADGTSGSRIVYNATAGVKVRSFRGDGNYTTIQGFEITHQGLTADGFRLIDMSGGTGWLIYNNTVHDNGDNLPGVRLLSVTSAIIRDNIIHHCGNARAEGSQPGIQVTGTDILIEDNLIHNVGDFITCGGNTRLVVRNNSMGPSTGDSTYHVDGLQLGDDNYVLFEGNLHFDNGGTDNHLFLAQTLDSRNFILRHNVTNDGMGTIACGRLGNTTTPGGAIYNNTFANNNLALGNGVIGFRSHVDQADSTGNFARNNIFYKSTNVATNPYVGIVDKDYDLYYLSGDPSETNDINADPLFVNESAGDLRLAKNSPAKEAGSHLTTVHASDSGSGTTLIVVNAQMFQDGWAGVDPDWVAVGSVGNTAQVSSIDYDTNIITLASGITRSDGDPVWLYKNSSRVVLTDSAPNIGALSVRAKSIPRNRP